MLLTLKKKGRFKNLPFPTLKLLLYAEVAEYYLAHQSLVSWRSGPWRPITI
jgi:hypothetical protein